MWHILAKVCVKSIKIRFPCLKLTKKTENVSHFIQIEFVCLKLKEKSENVAHFSQIFLFFNQF